MSNEVEEPSYIAFARANVREGLPSSPTLVRAMLERIDSDASTLKDAKEQK